MRFCQATDSDNRTESASIDALLFPEHTEVRAPKVEQAIATSANTVAESFLEEGSARAARACSKVICGSIIGQRL